MENLAFDLLSITQHTTIQLLTMLIVSVLVGMLAAKITNNAKESGDSLLARTVTAFVCMIACFAILTQVI